MEQKHSPLPWKSGMDIGATIKTQSVNKLIFSGNGLAILARCKNEDDTQFIVQACNAHYELLEACNKMMAMLRSGELIYSDPKEVLTMLVSAIAKTEGR